MHHILEFLCYLVLVKSQEDVAESKNKEGRDADQEPDGPEIESPPKSYYSEQEDFDWSDYKCDL